MNLLEVFVVAVMMIVVLSSLLDMFGTVGDNWEGRYESASEKIEAVKWQYNLSDDEIEAAVDAYRDHQSDDEAIPYDTNSRM